MAVCEFCKQDMITADGCVCVPVVIDGVAYEPLPVGDDCGYYESDDDRCPDCGAKYGHYHHPGCDVEECPKCGFQLISCDCNAERRCES